MKMTALPSLKTCPFNLNQMQLRHREDNETMLFQCYIPAGILTENYDECGDTFWGDNCLTT